jgi:hypothetical protein
MQVLNFTRSGFNNLMSEGEHNGSFEDDDNENNIYVPLQQQQRVFESGQSSARGASEEYESNTNFNYSESAYPSQSIGGFNNPIANGTFGSFTGLSNLPFSSQVALGML